MRLLEAAEVRTGEGNWMLGWETDSRECDVDVSLVDTCNIDDFRNVIDGQGGGAYYVAPFGILAELFRNVNCHRDDDASWLEKSLRSVDEYTLGRAMLIEPTAGSVTWVGGMIESPLPASADPSNEEYVAAIAAARDLWFRSTVGYEAPLMHVAPEMVPILIGAEVIEASADGQVEFNVWGDKVVVSPGYARPASLAPGEPLPWLFFTGPIEIFLSGTDSDGLIFHARQNRVMIQANQIAAINFSPCAAVRLGPVSEAVHALGINSSTNALAVTVTSPDANGQVTYSWGDGTPNTGPVDKDTPTTHTYANSGFYTISVTDDNGAHGLTTVQVAAPPVIPPVGPTMSGYWWAGGLTLNFKMVGLITTGSGHNIDWGDGSSASSFPPFVPAVGTTHTYAAPGSYNVVGTDSGGRKVTIPVKVSAASGTVTDTSPATAVLGSANQTLLVNGSGFTNPTKVFITNTGDNPGGEYELVTNPISATQASATLRSSVATAAGLSKVYVQNADGTRTSAVDFTFTATELAAAEAPLSEDEFPVDEFPIVAEVEPDETPGPYPLDEEKPKPKPTPPPAKKQQPKKNTGGGGGAGQKWWE